MANLYGENASETDARDTTHYHQKVEHNNLPLILSQLTQSADYHERRIQIQQFNDSSPILKNGMALTPVKFGISFTAQHLNQAGALVHIYTDGSILVNHGGTEMGQGLHTKIAQIVAEEFQVDVDTVGSTASRTDKVPNASPTAASSGTDLNGKAAQNAAIAIRKRLIEFACQHFSVVDTDVSFANNNIVIGDTALSFAEFVQLAYMNRISLSSTGFYKTPKIHFDRLTGKGRPFFYFSNGAAVSEVIVDTLTGEYKILRTDILHDVGTSLNPAIDIGQIEGAFVQGAGWLTTEELVWNDKGRLLSNNPATYKIPAISDAPLDFRVDLLPNEPNGEHTIYNSKAVGEPPFMLGISVWSAIRDAISSVSTENICPELDTPATPERVLFAIEKSKQNLTAANVS
jgi:xanthine dehydrogenase large subunit